MCNRESGVVTTNGRLRVFMCSPITDCHDWPIKHWKLSLFISLLCLALCLSVGSDYKKGHEEKGYHWW